MTVNARTVEVASSDSSSSGSGISRLGLTAADIQNAIESKQLALDSAALDNFVATGLMPTELLLSVPVRAARAGLDVLSVAQDLYHGLNGDTTAGAGIGQTVFGRAGGSNLGGGRETVFGDYMSVNDFFTDRLRANHRDGSGE